MTIRLGSASIGYRKIIVLWMFFEGKDRLRYHICTSISVCYSTVPPLCVVSADIEKPSICAQAFPFFFPYNVFTGHQ